MCPRPANARPLHVVRFAASWGWDPLVSSNHPSTPHRPAHAVSSNLPSTPHRPAHAVSSNLLGANACRALNRRALATRRHAWRNLLGMGSARVYPCMAGLVTGLARAGAMHHRHWYEVDIPMTVYRYEDLVENPMFVLEKALKSSGLWAKCTSFFLLFFWLGLHFVVWLPFRPAPSCAIFGPRCYDICMSKSRAEDAPLTAALQPCTPPTA